MCPNRVPDISEQLCTDRVAGSSTQHQLKTPQTGKPSVTSTSICVLRCCTEFLNESTSSVRFRNRIMRGVFCLKRGNCSSNARTRYTESTIDQASRIADTTSGCAGGLCPLLLRARSRRVHRSLVCAKSAISMLYRIPSRYIICLRSSPAGSRRKGESSLISKLSSVVPESGVRHLLRAGYGPIMIMHRLTTHVQWRPSRRSRRLV